MDYSASVELLTEKVMSWYAKGIAMLPNFAVAVLVVFVFFMLSKLAEKFCRRLFKRSQFSQNIESLIAGMIRVSVVCVGLFIALGILKLDKTVVSLLAGVGVLGLALGFAFQDLAANFISGIMIALRAPFKKGDLINISSTTGFVESIRIRDTEVRNFDGQIVIIPNKDFMENEITNYSINGKRKVKFAVGVSYDDDLEGAKAAVLKAVRGVESVLEDPAPAVYFTGFGASSIDMEAHIWIVYPGGDFLEVRDNSIIAVKRELDAGGYNIPFPIRTLDVPDDVLKQLR